MTNKANANTQHFTVPPITSRDGAQEVLAEFASLKQRLAASMTAMDIRLQEVRDEFAPLHATLDEKIEAHRAALESWAWSVKDAEFAEKKSLELAHGTISFRLAPTKLALMSRMTWAKVVERLTGKFEIYKRTTTVEAPDKELLLKHIEDGTLTTAQRTQIGLRTEQEENFGIDLKT